MIRFTPSPLQESPERPEIEYPCTWIYKVIGEDCSLLKDIIISACSPLPVKISHSHTSSKGKYHSLNAELEVPTEEVRLRIYELLKCSPVVKIVL
jgi:putative lipoic acid-binding regulatory protein